MSRAAAPGAGNFTDARTLGATRDTVGVGHAQRFRARFKFVWLADGDVPPLGRRTVVIYWLAVIWLGSGGNGAFFVLSLQSDVVRVTGDDLIEEDLVAEIANAKEALAPAIDRLAGLFLWKRREFGCGGGGGLSFHWAAPEIR